MSVLSTAPMLYVSPIVEALRGRPRLVFWAATLAHALLWLLTPALFYASPPGDVPLVLAVGHEWQLGSAYGPPLAYWLAEIAFRAAGGSMFGVYVLAQICVVVTFWAVFALGRAIVGLSHAVLAILLMAGISAFAVPTPDFGPAVLAMPLSALTLLHYWGAVGEGRSRSWLLFGLFLGLLGLTSYLVAILLGLFVVFTAATDRGRATLTSIYPYAGIAIAGVVALPHLAWLWGGSGGSITAGSGAGVAAGATQWVALLAGLAIDHAGLVVLVLVVGALLADRRAAVPVIEREPVDPFAKLFVYVFALAPAALATLLAALGGRSEPVGGEAPLVVLSGLAVIVAAGDLIRLHRQAVAGWTWFALLVGPPVLSVATMVVLPWLFATDVAINAPGREMGRFFTESFNRRTGKPLAIVVGDGRLGGLVALASPQRPSLFVDASPQRAPWVSEADVRERGAIVVWRLTDAAGALPAHLRARFPDLVAEVPRAFERPVQGRLPLLRIGWATIRPQAAPPQATTPPQANPPPATAAPPQ
jgi:4-amino-4-deoxy-L-arabinose transferase-like glycosyltransferase